MSSTMIRNADVRPWAIEHHGERAMLRIGGERIALAEISGFSPCEHHERDIDGPILTFAVYVLLAFVFVIGVMIEGWRARFLIAAALFGAIALFSMGDAIGMNRFSVYRIVIRTRAGRELRFATAERAEIEGLAAALRDRGIAHQT